MTPDAPTNRERRTPAPDTRERELARQRFRSSREAEARLLLLIDSFSRKRDGTARHIEGRVKLAKLDFLLRYPGHLKRVLENRGAPERDTERLDVDEAPLDSRMMRYRYGPWDPAYFAVLGSLIGRGLVEVTPLASASGFGYRTTTAGAALASDLSDDASFSTLLGRLKLLRRHLDMSGTTLKNYLYELPEVADANWHEDLT